MTAVVVPGCSQPGSLQGAAPSPLPLPAGITVAFNHRAEAHYRSPISGAQRSGDDLEALLLETIRGAQRELLVAVQELSLPQVARALVEQHRRGLRVQVVLENTYSQPWSSQHEAELSPHLRQRRRQLMALADRNRDGQLTAKEREQGDAVALLQRGGVPLLDDTADGSRGSALMHSKFVVADRRVVVTGSANFTPSCIHGDPDDRRTRGNVNHLLRFDSSPLAELFAAEFQRMWGDGPGGASDSRFGLAKGSGAATTVLVGATPVTVLFAPHRRQDPNGGLRLIGNALASAERRVDLALFVFSAQTLTQVIAELQRRGVPLRLLADPGFASRSFSEVLDLLGVALADRHCKLEAGNQPLTHAGEGVGIPRLPGGDKLHHKFAVIDNRTVITGSFNWSPSAAHQNDEVLLVIESPLLAAHFTREMDRLWRGAELGINGRLARKLAANRRRCGSGVRREIAGD
ncbi:MAG: phosphatidylserine/phosphatidylglycerophosphate/cardiolipin synthase family protein [Cyanobacteria bacterium M_DeepCast_200m_mx_001]|nr:phosphatidylserine/phosphatidylglycerophosphate/cardiolipin synthase family protein [Cyanobacteria bacterium M_DeepCast_200m_mx_001]